MNKDLSGRDGRVTIDQVAKRAGVSKTTVSRYLNNRFEMLGADTQERIRLVIEELNYRPSRIAQGLRAKYSRMIGCLVSDISNPFSAIIVQGINSVCVEQGYQILLVDSGNDPKREREGIYQLLESRVDGLLVNTTGGNDAFLCQLAEEGTKLVLTDRQLMVDSDIDCISTESVQCSYDCMAMLHQMGYQRVAFFTQGNEGVPPRIHRFQGFCKAMEGLFGLDGQEYCYTFDIHSDSDCEDKVQAFQEKYPNERLAIFAVNGVVTMRLLTAFQALNIDLGAQFGVCGFDDWGWAGLITPGITTIAQDSWGVGERAAQLIIQRIEETGPQQVVREELPNVIKVRGSTTK